MNNLVINELSEKWQKSGINKGDLILLHSNITRLLLDFKSRGIKLDLNLIIESFLTSVGSQGTLLLPLFNFNFTKGETFNIKSTPSKMGVLTEYFRKNFNIIRTGHPIYSFAVYGRKANHFFKNFN